MNRYPDDMTPDTADAAIFGLLFSVAGALFMLAFSIWNYAAGL